MFQKTDTDGNGSLSLEEFKAGAPQGAGGAQAPQGAPDIRYIFSRGLALRTAIMVNIKSPFDR
jgi:hypothetical protein